MTDNWNFKRMNWPSFEAAYSIALFDMFRRHLSVPPCRSHM